MKKRFLSLLCVLALCLGLLPVTALAAGDAPATLYVGETQITGNGYWTTEANGKLAAGNASNYNVYYDGSGTLTLKNATIQGRGNSSNAEPQDYGIYATTTSDQSVSLTIKLIGSNTVSGYSGICVDASNGNGNSTLVIQSDGNDPKGSLEAIGSGWNGITMSSNSGNVSLTINNASVEASTKRTGYYGVSVTSNAGSPTISLTVNGGSLTAQGDSELSGIRYIFQANATTPSISLTVQNNAWVKAMPGIDTAQSMASKPTPQGNGIVFDGTEGTVYGNVTLQDDLTIDQDETLTIPEGSTLDTNGNLTNNGTIVNKGTLNGDLTGGTGTVVNAPAITDQPNNATVTVGQPATFTVAASGSEPLSYKWQESNSSGNWADISGATDATYTTGATTTSMSGYQYRCVVSNSAGSVTSEVATLTVNEPAPTTYTITADVTPSGAGTATSDKTTATAGDTVKLTATANSGYRFTGWTFSDNITGADSSSANTTFTMPAGNVTVTANFKQVYTVTVNVSGNGTAIADKNTAAAGETVTLTATPNSGYHFDRWNIVSGTITIQNNQFTMPDGNVEIQAIFDRNSSGGSSDPTYSVSLPSQVTGGSITATKRYAEKGETFRFTVTPDEGYELDTLTVTDSKGKEIDLTHKGGNEYTFKMPAGRVEIEVSFREIEVELPFTDVPEGAWYADAAAYVYEHGLMAGTSATAFSPDATTSRSMIATILWRMAGSPVVNYAMDYTDVAQGQWCSEAIRWAASEGIVGGYGNGLFGTNDPITREQFAVMLYRYAQEQGYDVSIGEDTNILSYTDVADLSEYAIPAMQWAVGAGIINGTGDGSTLSPQGQATRAQAAVMLMRFCEEYVTW